VLTCVLRTAGEEKKSGKGKEKERLCPILTSLSIVERGRNKGGALTRPRCCKKAASKRSRDRGGKKRKKTGKGAVSCPSLLWRKRRGKKKKGKNGPYVFTN